MKPSVNPHHTVSAIEFPNEVIKTIYTRRSVRKFKNKSVNKELINELLNAGMMAPSAINKQPWKFYVLTNKEEIKKFSKQITKEAVKGILKTGLKEIIDAGRFMFQSSHAMDFINMEDHIFYEAPVVVFITSPKDDNWGTLDVGMCAQNIMLAAKSLGLDTCPVGLATFIDQTEMFSKLNIPGTDHVNLAIIVGYGDENLEAKPRISDNVFFI